MIRTIRIILLALVGPAVHIGLVQVWCTYAERGRPGPDRDLRRASALQSGAQPVLFARQGAGGFPPQRRDRHSRDQPAEQGHASADGAKAPGLWVVPFIRPYRTRADIQTWFNDPAIYDLIQDEYERGYYRGVGEFHIYGKSAATEWSRRSSTSRSSANLYLHAHCDEEALLILFAHNPKRQDHLGAYRLFDAAGARRGTVRRNIRRCGASCPIAAASPARRRHAVAGMARPVRAAFGPLPDRLRHLDQRALVLLRRHHEGLSRLAGAIAARSRRERIANGNAERLFGPRKAE